MDWQKELYDKNELPLDRLVDGYSNTSIFRTMAFIGDSLSSGEFEILYADGSRSYHDMYDYSWGQYIARKNGLKAYNFSRGGMSTKEYMESFATANGFWDKDKACQAYVIALGVNDLCGLKMELGSAEDVCVSDYRKNKPTFAGYYAQIISRYKEISPNAKFFLVSFPYDCNIMQDKNCVDMFYVLKRFTEMFDNTYLIDLKNYGPIYDEKFREKFYLNGHLSPSGYIFTARIIDSYIDYIIRHNPEDFKNVGFINSGISQEK